MLQFITDVIVQPRNNSTKTHSHVHIVHRAFGDMGGPVVQGATMRCEEFCPLSIQDPMNISQNTWIALIMILGL